MSLADASSQTEQSTQDAHHQQPLENGNSRSAEQGMGQVYGSEQIIRPLAGHCGFYVQRKKRFCKMTVRPGAQYCGEHSPVPSTEQEIGNGPIHSLRVPCPYDPKHTCFATKMEKHLRICNSKPPATLPEYVVPGINTGRLDQAGEPPAPCPPNQEGEKKEPLSLNNVSDEKLINIIGKLMSTYKKFIGKIPLDNLEHLCLKEELDCPDYGPNVLKHLIQNSSLIGQMDKERLLENGNTFVEFGSGRGALTYWLTKAVEDPSTCQFILVDKASHRHKFDNRLKWNEELEILRLRVDIADLVLGRVRPQLSQQRERVVGVSKHLCGAATDLAIRCMANTLTEVESELQGLVIALCCHHRCSWGPYVGKEFLSEEGFTSEDFSLLSSLTSWCTCGSGKPRKQQEEQERPRQEHDSHGHTPEVESQPVEVVKLNKDRYTRLQLDQATREVIGRQAKRVLDYGRLRYLEEHTGLEVKLRHFVDPFISLENALIVCSRPLGATG